MSLLDELRQATTTSAPPSTGNRKSDKAGASSEALKEEIKKINRRSRHLAEEIEQLENGEVLPYNLSHLMSQNLEMDDSGTSQSQEDFAPNSIHVDPRVAFPPANQPTSHLLGATATPSGASLGKLTNPMLLNFIQGML